MKLSAALCGFHLQLEPVCRAHYSWPMVVVIKLASVAFLALFMGGCVHGSSAPVAPAGVVAAPGDVFPDEAVRLELFAFLVDAIREYHVFNAPPHTPDAEWEAHLPGIEAEFREAEDLLSLNIALHHLGNSLRNPHCFFSAGGVLEDLPSMTLTSGFRLKAEVFDGSPRLYLGSIEDESLGVAPGDVLVAIDGTENPLVTHSLDSHQNYSYGLARDVARHLSSTRTSQSTYQLDETTRWTFAPREGGERVEIETRWKESEREPGPSDFSELEYEGDACGTLSDRHYGPGYRRTAAGMNYCLYASDHPDFKAYPVVRYFSFFYIPPGYSTDMYHTIRAEWYGLSAHLDALEDVEGIVLDLRDNTGGFSPNLFLSWWATKPWDTGYEHKRAIPALLEEPLASAVFRRTSQREAYRAQLEAVPPDADFLAPQAWDPTPGGSMTRTPDRRVTDRPVALLVGPGCVSSCDSFSLSWSRNDMGPLVGERTASAYTSSRLRLPVKAGDLQLGTLSLAIGYETLGDDPTSTEAVPIPLTVSIPHTFDNTDSYDADVVSAAIDALQKRTPNVR